MCGDTDENPARLWSVPAATAPVDVVHLPEGVAVVRRHLAPSHLVCCLRAKALIRLRVSDDDVIGVVPPLEASFVGGGLGGSLLCFFGARRCSGLFFKDAMYAIAGVSKTMAFTELSESRHPPANSL